MITVIKCIAILATAASFCPPVTTALQLNVTAIYADSDAHATLECWRLDGSPFSNSLNGALAFMGNAANLTYVVAPPGVDTGVHKPPANQYVTPIYFTPSHKPSLQQ